MPRSKRLYARHEFHLKTALLYLMFVAAVCTSFQLHSKLCHPVLFQSRSNNSLTRLASEGSNDNEDDGGRQLAEELSKEIKRRASLTTDTSEAYDIKSNLPPPTPIRKFTGASTPLFTNNSNETPNTNLQREREREFNLASRFERTFPIQAAIILASAIFISLVGITGGITDGSERNFYGDDDLIEDAVVERLERIRTDDAAEVRGSYWL